MLTKREAGSFILGCLVGGIGIRWTTHAFYLTVIAALIVWHVLK